MKMAIKRKKGGFLVINLKHVFHPTVVVNLPRSPKLWAIARENSHKAKNDKFFVITLKHVSGLMVVVNRPRTPKLWVIAHEIVHKERK